jgi:hypothetical protein
MLSVELMTMFIRRLHKLPLLSLLVLSLLTSPLSSLGYVWCLSADGHATLEAAMAGDCGLDDLAPTGANTPVAAWTGGGDDCGPCLDVSPSHQWGSPRSRQADTSSSFATELSPVTVATYSKLPDLSLNNHRTAATIPRTPDPILHHRTIVLLI